MRRIRYLGAAAAALFSGIAIGCVPEQQPQTVFLTGDSITWGALLNTNYEQVYMDRTGHDPDTLSWYAGPGWTMGLAFWGSDYVEAPVDRQSDVTQAGDADVVINAFGMNEAGDGWSASDEAPWQRGVAEMGPEQCLVLVRAGVAPGMDPVRAQGIAGQRRFVDELAASRGGRTVVVDVQPMIDAHPEYMGDDGVHNVSTVEAYEARLDVYFDGARRCDGLS